MLADLQGDRKKVGKELSKLTRQLDKVKEDVRGVQQYWRNVWVRSSHACVSDVTAPHWCD